MPQLNKGGKWVFGWVIVGEDRRIRIPPPAYNEYGFQSGGVISFTRSSRSSGGFGMGRQEIILEDERIRTRVLIQRNMEENMLVHLPSLIDVQPREHLLAVRGSYLVLSFLQRGPIYKEALYHPEIEIFFP